VPAVLISRRCAMPCRRSAATPEINPLVPVDLVIDHSVIVNFFGDNKAFAKNVVEEYSKIRGVRIPEMGPEGVFEFLRGAARHRICIRSISNTSRRRYGPARRR